MPIAALCSNAQSITASATRGHIHRIGDHQRTFQHAHLVNLLGVGHFAKSVDANNRARHFFQKQIAWVRQNCRDAGANRSLIGNERAFALNDGGVPDAARPPHR